MKTTMQALGVALLILLALAGFTLHKTAEASYRLSMLEAAAPQHPCFCDTCCEAHWAATHPEEKEIFRRLPL